MRWWERVVHWMLIRRTNIASIDRFRSEREAMEQATRRPID